MTELWSIIVIAITLLSIFGCALLLIWNLKDKMGKKDGESMGHEFDGIEELNNPLPAWWSIMFVMTIVFGLGYLVLFPGLGNFEGLLGWRSSNQGILNLEQSAQASQDETYLVKYDLEVKQADEKYAPIFAAYAEKSLTELANDAEAMKIGQRLFQQNCSQCHGSDAKGSKGFPNLTDDDWLWGGTEADIKTTLLNGRSGVMTPWEQVLGDQGVDEVVEYVLSLSGRRGLEPRKVEAGKNRFVICAACHGADGKGNQQLGAPNLTDNIWVYGGSRKVIEQTVRHGRNGVMPAWKDILGEEKVHVLSGYVYSLSQ